MKINSYDYYKNFGKILLKTVYFLSASVVCN